MRANRWAQETYERILAPEKLLLALYKTGFIAQVYEINAFLPEFVFVSLSTKTLLALIKLSDNVFEPLCKKFLRGLLNMYQVIGAKLIISRINNTYVN